MPTKKVKIGVAMGGGGAKGAAHIGILKVFEKYNISIDSIVGSSAGAIIGASYALGLTADQIFQQSAKFSKMKLLRLGNFHIFNESLMKSRDVKNAIQELVGEHTFDDLKIPFQAVAVDLESGKEVLLHSGKLWESLRASSAIPGIFSPYFLNEKYLVDGGLLNSVPVNYLREQKDIDIVIGIQLGDLTSKQYISGIVWERYYRKNLKNMLGYFKILKINSTLMFHILLRSIDILRDEVQNYRYQTARPDIIIAPEIGHISFLEMEHYADAMKEGEKAAEKTIPQLLELISKKQQAAA